VPSPKWLVGAERAARLATTCVRGTVLRFELVTEDPSAGPSTENGFLSTRRSFAWRAMSANGDVMSGEMRLRSMMDRGCDALTATGFGAGTAG